MRYILAFQLALVGALAGRSAEVQTPVGLVCRAGDQSIVLHWEGNTEPEVSGYRVYRSLTNGTAFTLLGEVMSPGFCDLSPAVINGHTNFYQITAVTKSSQESSRSAVLSAVPHAFASDDEFLEYVQQASFDYFWYLANPRNGLVPDRSARGSAFSIAAQGFGLTALAIGIDHGWITRAQGVARVLTTLNTFLHGRQGPNAVGTIGYRGWFYHFLDMNTGMRSGAELSSIDTALLLAGMLDAKQYFNGASKQEAAI